ncbi:MAG: MarR family transcriptional regulator [Parvibaculales bacterium]
MNEKIDTIDIGTDFIDAIELMFFAYRDFIADPDAILSHHGFGRAHHRVLHFVANNRDISIAELLDILRITKQSLARVLRDLIDAGYVQQKTGQQDRRQRLLRLTLRGHRLHQQLMAPQQQRFRKIEQQIGTAAFNKWKKTMRLVINSEERNHVDRLIKKTTLDEMQNNKGR